MKRHLAWIATSLILISCFASVPRAGAVEAEASALSARQQVLHVLNRLGFGPRPGDVDRVLAIGLNRYIEQQLHPERISDPIADGRLATIETLGMSTQQLFDRFQRPVIEARRARKKNAADEAKSGTPDDEEKAAARRRASIPPGQRPRRVIEELNQARVLRAVYSERQLNEVMVDFWMNHFNVFANKNLDRVLVTSYERDVIRPNIWGRFSDLLMATAKSPAMLIYLDNARSVADEDHRKTALAKSSPFGRRGQRWPEGRSLQNDAQMRRRGQGAGQKSLGLNENYARELMELHTLGVEGGYAQKDVTEMARLLTGWSIRPPQQGQIGFIFREQMHDAGTKTVLGQRFPAGGGIEEGERMIRVLARHPSTAHHIAFQLCQRLIADEPSAALVDRVAKRFLATDGDLRETVRAVIESPEFFSPALYRAKVKSPFEYVVSAIRAVNGDTDGRAVAMQIGKMGEPLYLCQPPTGYSDTAATWVNSGALVARLNFALALADSKVPGTRLVAQRVEGDPITFFARQLIGGDLSRESRKVIDQRLRDDPSQQPSALTEQGRSAVIAGLILGSPEFQRQ